MSNNKNKIIVNNREAAFNYEILETYQAGIVLTGAEVKSVKNQRISLKGSYVTIDPNSEVWLVKCYIAPYQPASGQQKNYDPERPKKLLLNKKEIKSLIGKSGQRSLTIIPINVYTKKGLIKVDIALAKGKSKIDKREKIKKRETDRQIKRTLKQK